MSFNWINMSLTKYGNGNYMTAADMTNILNNFQYLKQQLALKNYTVTVEDNTSRFSGNTTHPIELYNWQQSIYKNFESLYDVLQKANVFPFAYEEFKTTTITAFDNKILYKFQLGYSVDTAVKVTVNGNDVGFISSLGAIILDTAPENGSTIKIYYYSFFNNYMLKKEPQKLLKYNNICSYLNYLKDIVDNVKTKPQFLQNSSGNVITDINGKRITVYSATDL